jgi:hypothetical protein
MALTNKKVKEEVNLEAGVNNTPVITDSTVAEFPKLVVNKKTEANQYMLEFGNSILEGMGAEFKAVGAMSNTLHFVSLLGLASKHSVRRTSEGNTNCSTTIGVTLVSDKSIKVPVINVLKNKDTGLEASDISYRRVKRGIPFNLNMYELMFLMVRKEYAGFMEYKGDSQGVYFSPKMSNYHRGEALLPTPTLSFKTGGGSIKENMIDIDEKVAGHGWTIKSDYQKDFGALIPQKVVRTEKADKSFPAPTAVALALGKLFEDKFGLEA